MLKVPEMIVVDLDGTLIAKDSSLLMFKNIIKKNPFVGLKAVFVYLFGSEAKVKAYIKKFDNINEEKKQRLNTDLINYLIGMKKIGKKLILATGADYSIAQDFNANEVNQLFDIIIASDGKINCIGAHKLRAIEKITKDFMYIGDSWYDCPVWFSASAIGVVKPKIEMRNMLIKHAKLSGKNLVIFD